jgi:hypothetical protein
MPKSKLLRHGVGADKITVFMKFFHPRAAILKRKSPNATKNDVLGNLLVFGQEEKLFSKCQQVCLAMQHDDFDDDQILHAVARFCKVTEKGPVESLFDILQTNDDVVNNKNVAIGGDENAAHEILSSVLNKTILSFQVQGFAVDDNDEPAIENIFTTNDSGADDIYQPGEVNH